MKMCRTCRRPKHRGLCDMVELTDGRIVHANRVALGGDLHNQIGDSLRVKNRWLKGEQLGSKKKQ